MRSQEATGRTVDEAVEQVLSEWTLPRSAVEIEVLEEPAKGLFGLIGNKPARVRVTEKNTPERAAVEFIKEMTSRMNVNAQVTAVEKDGTLAVDIEGDGMGILIGHRGETLNAIQYLTSLVVNKDSKEYIRVTVDTENYRAKREQTLKELAEKMASKARRTGRRVVLEPMNPYERRILHAALQGNAYVTTRSEGEEPNRRVVIELK
ncbi:protein jag [Christensenellaceae bacterium NSJ-44]|jgi:spoIIIJ-associated protein|uniref:RNA-binding protein KhpB n=1 Tax=Luoshenia tenuis TaxID=2763654 RepID=A0A926D0Q9_9FIRM|nr:MULTISPECIES: RNA-binding cell elongation regulator Jag/EloR [Clostridia]MBC8529291.1 protein jag [Luoshenia tenuis]SCI87775.1 R3H domain [uncultured Clostridium sp.]